MTDHEVDSAIITTGVVLFSFLWVLGIPTIVGEVASYFGWQAKNSGAWQFGTFFFTFTTYMLGCFLIPKLTK